MSPDEHEIMRSVEDHYWWYQALRKHVADSIAPASPTSPCSTPAAAAAECSRWCGKNFPGRIDRSRSSKHALELTAARATGAKLRFRQCPRTSLSGQFFRLRFVARCLERAGVDEALALHETHRVLRPGGKLILNVAAFDFLKGTHDCAVDVDRRYTKGQLRTAPRGLWFPNGKIELLERDFRAAHRVFTLAEPRPSAHRSAAFGFPAAAALINSLLKRVATLELNASRHVSLPFGTSLFAVARKNG